MVLKSDQQRVRLLLKEAIPMLLKNGLNFRTEFDLEVFVGITLDKDEMIHFSISETIKNDEFSDEDDDGDDTVEAITSGEKELTALDQGEDSCLETFSSFPSPKRLRLEPGTETDHIAQSHDSLDHRLSGEEHANSRDTGHDSSSPNHSGIKRKILEVSSEVDVKEELDVVVIKEEPPDVSGHPERAYQSNTNRSLVSRHQTFMPPTLSFGDDSSLFGDASSAMFSNTGDISFDKSLMDASLQQQQSHVGVVPVGSYIANVAGSSQAATCASASQASTSRSHQERLQQGQPQKMAAVEYVIQKLDAVGYVTTKFGKPAATYRGYRFRHRRTGPNGNIYWVCTRYDIKCKATLTTNSNGNFVRWSGEHDHPPNVTQCDVSKEGNTKLLSSILHI